MGSAPQPLLPGAGVAFLALLSPRSRSGGAVQKRGVIGGREMPACGGGLGDRWGLCCIFVLPRGGRAVCPVDVGAAQARGRLWWLRWRKAVGLRSFFCDFGLRLLVNFILFIFIKFCLFLCVVYLKTRDSDRSWGQVTAHPTSRGH